MKIDFLCVGFAKCGTTTLDAVLKQHTQIALPGIKETGFFCWCDSYEEPVKNELQKYYRNLKGKKAGIVEPIFWYRAKDVKKYFGENIKIMLIMRNPVERIYSNFKMKMRQGGDQRVYYKKGKDIPTIFHTYVEDQIAEQNENKEKISPLFSQGNYIRWIREYEEEFGKENIHLIFMEEFFKTPEDHVKRILEFIEVSYEQLDTSVRANEGKKVSRGYCSSTINKWLYRKVRAKVLQRKRPAKLRIALLYLVEALMQVIGVFTLVDNKQKMLPETRKILEDYYKSSNKELENYTGKDLSKIWY